MSTENLIGSVTVYAVFVQKEYHFVALGEAQGAGEVKYPGKRDSHY